MSTQTTKTEPTKTDPPKTTAAVPEAAKSDPTAKETYLNQMVAQGKEWEGQMALWGAKADKATAEVKGDFQKWRAEFRDQKTAANKKLDAVRAAADNAWEEVKKANETAWTDLRTGFEAAKKKYE